MPLAFWIRRRSPPGKSVAYTGLSILKPQLRLLVNDDVGSETLAKDSPICEAGDPGRQAADLVVGLFQAHDLAVAGPHRQKVDRPSPEGQVPNVGATVRDARVDVGV